MLKGVDKLVGRFIEKVYLNDDIQESAKALAHHDDYVSARDGGVVIEFTCGSRAYLFDDGRSCCESRYMTTDVHDLDSYAGAQLLNIEVVPGGTIGDADYDVHQIEFLYLRTNRGSIDFVSHNEHNGYYGGLDITLVASVADGPPVIPKLGGVKLGTMPKRALEL